MKPVVTIRSVQAGSATRIVITPKEMCAARALLSRSKGKRVARPVAATNRSRAFTTTKAQGDARGVPAKARIAMPRQPAHGVSCARFPATRARDNAWLQTVNRGTPATRRSAHSATTTTASIAIRSLGLVSSRTSSRRINLAELCQTALAQPVDEALASVLARTRVLVSPTWLTGRRARSGPARFPVSHLRSA